MPSMSAIRLAVSVIVDAHLRVDLDSPVTVGIAETLRGLTRQVGAADWTSTWQL